MILVVRALAAQRQPSVFYMPSVGMYLSTIFAASLRLAPVQLTALGHAASTHSPWVDYFAVDEDFIGELLEQEGVEAFLLPEDDAGEDIHVHGYFCHCFTGGVGHVATGVVGGLMAIARSAAR